MKTLVALTIATACCATSAQTGVYRKAGGQAEIGSIAGRSVPFSLVATKGQARCELEGKAEMVDATRAAFTTQDRNDKCVAVLNFANSGLKVTTKGCESYCGAGAAGAMDGSYTPKR